MIALTTQAANILNLYLWAILKKNTTMLETDYSQSGQPGRIPIIPGGQDPDFNQYNKPYIVYGFSEDPVSVNGTIRGGTLVYAIYSTGTGINNSIMNIIISALSEDDTARRINKWSSTNAAFIGIRFTDARVVFGEGSGPLDQEGGREMATLTMRYEFVAKYTVDLNV